MDRLLSKDANPEEYDLNMGWNDVYDAFDVCLIDYLLWSYWLLALFDEICCVVVKWSFVDDIMKSECFNL